MHLAILTPSYPGTTFAANELDFQVRDVTGYFLTAIDTPKSSFDIKRTFALSISKPNRALQSFTITKQDKQVSKNHVVNILKKPSSMTFVPVEKQENKAKRVISIGQLNVLLRLHTQPIKLVVYKHP